MRCARGVGLAALLWANALAASADRVDDYILAQMRWQHIPGLSLAVVQDGKILKAKGYGLANVETGTPAAPETVYKIGSVSKQFLAAGILLLVQEGRISLDDPIRSYLEDAPAAWKEITVRRLLTHTAGLVREAPGFDPFKVQPDADVIKTAYPLPLRSPPGEKWEYSNVGYFALAEIIHRVSGKPWEAFLAERLFAPLRMTATRTTTTTEIVPHRASGYAQSGGRRINAANWPALRPSGAFLSTVTDLALWDAALSADAVLLPSSRTQMWTPVMLRSGTTYPYGFGWFLDDWQGHRRIHHDGGLPGFSSDFERFAEDRLTVIILVNIDNRDLRDVAVRVAGFYVPALVPIAAKPIPDTEPEVTAQIRAVLAGLAEGRLDTDRFTPAMASSLAGDVKAGFSGDLRRLGRIRSIALLERKSDGADQTYRYRLDYGNVILFVGCTINRTGKIARLSIQD